MPEEKSERRLNDHTKDNGTWCRWSKYAVTKEYAEKTSRCPDGCKASELVLEISKT